MIPIPRLAIPEYDADSLTDDLTRLSVHLASQNPDAQHHGVLGGRYGYGQHFSNAIFEMRPYYWGDCDCGYEESGQPEGFCHSADCSYHLLNFRHISTGIEVRWYKYIGRNMKSNQPVSPRRFRAIIDECIASARPAQ